MAFEKAQQWGEMIPIGVINSTDPSALDSQIPAIQEKSLLKQEVKPSDFKDIINIYQ